MKFIAYWLLFLVALGTTTWNYTQTTQSLAMVLFSNQQTSLAMTPILFVGFDLLILMVFAFVPFASAPTNRRMVRTLFVYQIIQTLLVLMLKGMPSDTVLVLVIVLASLRLFVATILCWMFLMASRGCHVALFTTGLQFVVMWSFFVLVSLCSVLAVNGYREVPPVRYITMFVIAVAPLTTLLIATNGFQYILHAIILIDLWYQMPEQLTEGLVDIFFYVIALDIVMLTLNLRYWSTTIIAKVTVKDWPDFLQNGGLGLCTESAENDTDVIQPSHDHNKKDDDAGLLPLPVTTPRRITVSPSNVTKPAGIKQQQAIISTTTTSVKKDSRKSKTKSKNDDEEDPDGLLR